MSNNQGDSPTISLIKKITKINYLVVNSIFLLNFS